MLWGDIHQAFEQMPQMRLSQFHNASGQLFENMDNEENQIFVISLSKYTKT